MTPLERAARALVDNYPLDGGESPLAWQEVLPVARAVIVAIREPSEGMLEAAYRDLNLSREDADTPDVEITRAWRAMIDALLEEGK